MIADTEQLIDLLRAEGDDDDGLLSRLLLCRFLATSALVVLARSEDNIERAVSTWSMLLCHFLCLYCYSYSSISMQEDKSRHSTISTKMPYRLDV